MTPCTLCGDGVPEEGGLACARCGAPHHPDCWEYSDGCTVYGCGSDGQVPLEKAPKQALMVLEEGSESTLLPVDRVEAWRRWLVPHLREMPSSIAWGLGGMGVGVCILAMLRSHSVPWFTNIVFVASGVLHGVLAPFLARLQHRRPGRVGLAALAVFVVLFRYLDGWTGLPFLIEGGLVATMLATWMTTSSCFSDLLVGPRSRLGQRLGPRGGWVRLGVTWVGAILVFFLWPLLGGMNIPSWPEFMRIALFAGMISVSAVPALERGKQVYLERLPPSRR